MNSVKEVQNNCLKVSEDVINRIVEIAVSEVKGVYGLSNVRFPFSNIFVNSEKSPAVKIKMHGDAVEISVSIIVTYGCKVSLTAENVQKKIKEDIQTMTGVTVSKINVFISGVSLSSDK